VNVIALLNAAALTVSFGSYIDAYYGKHKKLEDFQSE